MTSDCHILLTLQYECNHRDHNYSENSTYPLYEVTDLKGISVVYAGSDLFLIIWFITQPNSIFHLLTYFGLVRFFRLTVELFPTQISFKLEVFLTFVVLSTNQ